MKTFSHKCIVHISAGRPDEQSINDENIQLLPETFVQMAQQNFINFWLKFSIGEEEIRNSEPSEIWLQFFPSHNLGDAIKPNRSCNFESFSPSGGGLSVLNLCSPKSINGILRICDELFYLYLDNNKFMLGSPIGKCDFRCLKKRAISEETTTKPDYYKDYLDEVKRYVELAFVADNSIFKKYGEDEVAINNRLNSIANIVNSLYAPLNIRVTLVWAEIWKEKDKIEVTKNPDKTLENFMTYRKSLLKDRPNDNAHLITDVQFGSVVGKGYRGTICSFDYSGGVIVDHSIHPAFVGGTVAHEMGHNFGMDHDAGYPDPCRCPASSCVMAPVSNNINTTTFFSDCSLNYLEHAFKRGVDYCLRNVPETIFGGAKCGNGVVEHGEECDCGFTTKCPNKCCIASECKLAKDAICANGDCCDLETCKPKPMATVCRNAAEICDLPEYCDGQNPNCPADFFIQNGHQIPEDPNNYCYEGISGNRDKQCQKIWGAESSNSVPECYAFNMHGTMSGNCGYDQLTEVYKRCNTSNLACGRLQCQSTKQNPIFGDPSTVYSVYNFITKDNRQELTCRAIKTAYVGNKKWPDPGMVKNGANCGADRMCVGTECRNRTELMQMVPKCDPENCNGKGICNNVGNCHCVPGYGGIRCDIPGYGGSVNSGPATDKIFNPGLVLLYLGIVGIIIFIFLTYYCKKKWNFWLHKKIWRHARDTLNIRSMLVPIRRAPARPGGKSQAQSRRFSLNEVWGDPSAQSNNVPNVIRVNAAKTTYLTTNVLRPSPITGVVDDKFKASHEPLQLQQLSSGLSTGPYNLRSETPSSTEDEVGSSRSQNNREATRLIKTNQTTANPIETPPPVPPHRAPPTSNKVKLPSPADPKQHNKPKLPKKPVKKIEGSNDDSAEKSVTVNVRQLAARFDKG